MKTLVLSLALLGFFACSSTAQKDYDALEKTLKQKYPNATAISWEVDDHGRREAHFKLDDKKYRADFSNTGDWIETERSIRYKDLPDAVKEAIKKDYDPDDIVEVEYVESSTKGTFYDVEIKEKGKKKRDIEFSEDGRVIGVEEKKM